VSGVVSMTFTMIYMGVVSNRLLGHGMGSMAPRSAGRGMHVLMGHVGIVLILMFGLRFVRGIPPYISQ